MTSVPPQARFADHLLNGEFEQFILNGRKAKRSWETLARELRDLTNQEVDVSGLTVAAWARRMNISEPVDAA